jgi:hypothetical protein
MPNSVSNWLIALCYLLPVGIVLTTLSADGWYGTGATGQSLGAVRLLLFFAGMVCAYYSIAYGSWKQRLAVAPAVLGYTGLVVGIAVDTYL